MVQGPPFTVLFQISVVDFPLRWPEGIDTGIRLSHQAFTGVFHLSVHVLLNLIDHRI